ncbi:hypothetical protein Ccrd_003182 [Cynara cardunculus var. scolymus]|uniref:Uncharacterized protein n=1 Tax=Cynara cardunculus var. scolymus TaxID=59895 RepID=A0A118JVW8_CYNCS|nr:hypothetical protein Ccrd_003182 [Cynara cardunculus var. scolymus]
MAIPHGMTAEEYHNFRRDRQIEELQRSAELITQQLARLLDDKQRNDGKLQAERGNQNNDEYEDVQEDTVNNESSEDEEEPSSPFTWTLSFPIQQHRGSDKYSNLHCKIFQYPRWRLASWLHHQYAIPKSVAFYNSIRDRQNSGKLERQIPIDILPSLLFKIQANKHQIAPIRTQKQ